MKVCRFTRVLCSAYLVQLFDVEISPKQFRYRRVFGDGESLIRQSLKNFPTVGDSILLLSETNRRRKGIRKVRLIMNVERNTRVNVEI